MLSFLNIMFCGKNDAGRSIFTHVFFLRFENQKGPFCFYFNFHSFNTCLEACLEANPELLATLEFEISFKNLRPVFNLFHPNFCFAAISILYASCNYFKFNLVGLQL